MAMKGHGYIKTNWNYQERPVGSSKLNAWDDAIEHALELVHEMLSLAWGGGDGVVRGATANDLHVVANVPQDMGMKVRAGRAFIAKYVYKLAVDTATPPVQAPVAQPRIDIVQARLMDWSVTIRQGTESATPTPPAPDSNCLVLAQVYCRPGMSCVKDSDDGVNGYIIDARQYL